MANAKLKSKGKDETDEMKLKLRSEQLDNESMDPLYPAELNEHLTEQLKVLTCEGNELRKCVYAKDQEIKEMTKMVGELNQRIRDLISGSGPAISAKSAGVISAKIADLCKQNRHLIAELESYKTKNSSLERKLMHQDIMLKDHEKSNVCICKEEPIDSSPDELKDLHNKLNGVNKKLYETKNRNFELKNDILLATKILQQELGDKFTSIKELQKDLAGWKGRAQQIVLLQNRVTELEEKLNGKQKDLIDATKKKDQYQIIRDLELKRKREMDQSLKDLTALRDENVDLKKKLDGAKCRVRNLECDVITIRQKMQTFSEKSNHDDKLINEQRNQIKNLELYYQELLKENTSKMSKMNTEIMEFQKVISSSDAKFEAMMRQATEKATKIEELRAQLLRYEECSLQSVFFTPMKTATDNQIQKLTELTGVLNKRLDNERHKWEELEAINRKLKIKNQKLERKVISLEETVNTMKESRMRLTRLSKSSIQKDGSQMSVQKVPSTIPIVTEASDVSFETQTSYDLLDKEELKFRLQLADEKYKIMEDKLKMIEEEKNEDYTNLTEMIQNSKQLFSEALSILQKEKCTCP